MTVRRERPARLRRARALEHGHRRRARSRARAAARVRARRGLGRPGVVQLEHVPEDGRRRDRGHDEREGEEHEVHGRVERERGQDRLQEVRAERGAEVALGVRAAIGGRGRAGAEGGDSRCRRAGAWWIGWRRPAGGMKNAVCWCRVPV